MMLNKHVVAITKEERDRFKLTFYTVLNYRLKYMTHEERIEFVKQVLVIDEAILLKKDPDKAAVAFWEERQHLHVD